MLEQAWFLWNIAVVKPAKTVDGLKTLKQKLYDQYIQQWLSLNEAASSRSSNNDKLFKTDFVKSTCFGLVS